jgi:hypothetical protein
VGPAELGQPVGAGLLLLHRHPVQLGGG